MAAELFGPVLMRSVITAEPQATARAEEIVAMDAPSLRTYVEADG